MAQIITWDGVMSAAMKLPGIQVSRQEYLVDAFSAYGDATSLSEKRPIDVFDGSIVEKVAKDAINAQTQKVTTISTVAGLPGGVAMFGTIPADLAQYYFHVMVIAQKLCYIYGWPDLKDEQGKMGEEACRILTIFVGVMLGSQAANKLVGEISKKIALQVTKRLPQQALTKGFIYPIVKQIAKWIGVKMTKDIFAKSVAKVVPIIGGVVSGTITYATFKPMAKKLQKELRNEMHLHKSIDDNFYFDEDVDEQVQNEQNQNLEYVKILACINIAKIDSDFSEKEISFLTQLIDEAELSDDEKVSLLALLHTRELTDMEFKPYKDNVMFVTSLLENLVEIIYLDGIVAPSERIYLYKIASDLGVPRNMVEDLLKSSKPDEG